MWVPPLPRTTPACSPHIQVHFWRGKPRQSVGVGTPSQRSQSREQWHMIVKEPTTAKTRTPLSVQSSTEAASRQGPWLARGPAPTHGYTLGGELCQHRAWGQLLFHLPGPALAWLLGSQAPPPYGHPRNFLPSGPAFPGLVPPTHQVGTDPQQLLPSGPLQEALPCCSLAALCGWMPASEGGGAAAPQALPHSTPTLTLRSLHLSGATVLPLPCPSLCCLRAGRGPLTKAECCLSRHWIPRRGWGPWRHALPPSCTQPSQEVTVHPQRAGPASPGPPRGWQGGQGPHAPDPPREPPTPRQGLYTCQTPKRAQRRGTDWEAQGSEGLLRPLVVARHGSGSWPPSV